MRTARIRFLTALAALAVLGLAAWLVLRFVWQRQELPITIRIWHVYGGQTDSPFNDQIDEFNATVGKQRNIRVQVDSVSNTNTIHQAVLAAANRDPGAAELPDLFISYPKTVLELPDPEILVDFRDHFSESALEAFVPAFLEEGEVEGRLAVLPLAKSTELIFVNKTVFDRYAAQSALAPTLESFSTWESLFAMAEDYRQWSASQDGKGRPFFVHDYHFNYFQAGAASQGEDFLDKGRVLAGRAFAKAWDPYARGALTGGLWLGEGYATEPLRTGDAIASMASSASILYYSHRVTYEDNTSEEVELTVLPPPVWQGGEKVAMQRGAGICALRSDAQREAACMLFLEWILEPERNRAFAMEAGYMPVMQEAYGEGFLEAMEELQDPMYRQLYKVFGDMAEEYRFCTPPLVDGYLEKEQEFEMQARKTLSAYRQQFADWEAAKAPDGESAAAREAKLKELAQAALQELGEGLDFSSGTD